MPPRIRFENVSKSHLPTSEHASIPRGVARVSFHVEPGEWVALLGASGAGKSTLLRLAAGLDACDAGQIFYDDLPLRNAQHFGEFGAFAVQNPTLYPNLNVAQQLDLPLRLRHVPSSERERRVTEALHLFDLEPLRLRHPGELSGGEVRRLNLAIALIRRPEVLLLDEALSQINLTWRLELVRRLRRYRREFPCTAVFVSHQLDEAWLLADRAAVLVNGTLRQVGTLQELARDPKDLEVADAICEWPWNRLNAVRSSSKNGLVLTGRTHDGEWRVEMPHAHPEATGARGCETFHPSETHGTIAFPAAAAHLDTQPRDGDHLWVQGEWAEVDYRSREDRFAVVQVGKNCISVRADGAEMDRIRREKQAEGPFGTSEKKTISVWIGIDLGQVRWFEGEKGRD